MMVESSKITLLPCDQPPSIRLRVMGPGRVIIFDDVLNHSSNVLIAQLENQGVTTSVCIQTLLDNTIETEIGIEVSRVICDVNVV